MSIKTTVKSNPKLSTYAETRFGISYGKNELDCFYSLIYEVATHIRVLYEMLRQKNNYNSHLNYDNLVSNFILSNQCNPDFLFYLIDQTKNMRHSVCGGFKVNQNNLGQDILMLKNINQRMSSKDLKKFHLWIISYEFKLQRLDAEILLKIYRLLDVPDKNNLTVAHKHLGALPISNQTKNQQNYLSVVR